MSVSLGIYDIFASAVPGSLYLAATIYLGIRLGWIDVADLASLDTTFAFSAALITSYLLGQTLGPALRGLVGRVRLLDASAEDVRAEFRRRNPTFAHRPFVEADPFTLLAGLRQTSPEAATEVDRSRAGGIMLRSASPALLFGSAIALSQAVVRTQSAAAAAGVWLLVLAGLSLREGQRRSRWAKMHTYECAAWIPDVDHRLARSDYSVGRTAVVDPDSQRCVGGE